MNSNQRSEGNNQSSNGANEKDTSSGRTTADKGNLDQSQQSGTLGGSQQGGRQQQDQQIDQQSTDRSGSQTGNVQQGGQGQRQSNDLAGGLPKSPGGKNLAADQKMDDDTGLSNIANRQSAQQDQGSRQMEQSNVGRRDDLTPD
ncbi:hypothetical protein [Massilia sp. CF038]|uniref:hypothetical protein n=1 Tax=Massilia sp. CF038 TaxID=1881045 RepID=UPI0009220F40|nr:hypothetical protein [Massilia sp. CF038]SHG52234.1 hypothetical protein SAMN05428948_0851 [Massilia sp. CF038]